MKVSSNRKVFNWCWNNRSVDAEMTVSGSEFQIWEAATRKARSPMVESLEWGTSRWLVLAERSARRPGMSATRVSGSRYHGTVSRKTCI